MCALVLDVRRRTLLSLLAAFAGGGCLADDRRSGGAPVTATPTPDDCPSFVDAHRTVCSTDDGPVTLAAESGEFTVDTDDSAVETFRLTVTNHALAAFRFNPYAWGLARRTDSRERGTRNRCSSSRRANRTPGR